ncbi:MAG: DUF962 domain-containing protein [Rheinheimera sp.]|nr:DUF962 domain-containing protein [Rheinheimera sp.]
MHKFSSFRQFYPYYLSEHRHPVCRSLHYIGSTLVLALLVFVLWSQQWRYLWLLPVIGYGFAWLGHFLFEHNKPATFQYPLYSLAADWVMLKDFLTGQLNKKMPD